MSNMSSFGDLDRLRRQNKELLQKLKHKTDILARVRLDCAGKQGFVLAKRSACEPTTLQEASESLLNVSDELINLSVSGNCPEMATSALCKQINITTTTPNPAGQDRWNSRPHVQADPTGTSEDDGSVISQEKSQRVVGRDRFPSSDEELETVSESERRRVQPLLGYDWIAGLLDAESSLTERSEHFFSELRAFRQVNKFPVAANLGSPSAEDGVTKHECASDAHQCTFCYRINSRLFATPLDPQAACPVCKTPKEKHPHTEREPAFIRVSIPRSTLLPAYRYKAHRRCSFDPSDSLGLPSHCLSGWTNISMGAGSKMSSLDLRSSMKIRPHPVTKPSVQDENQLMPPADSRPCALCKPGFILQNCKCVKCPRGQFWFLMNGRAMCDTCTESCSVKKNQVEVSACTETTNRRCQCKPGYYCPSRVGLKCRRDCELCTSGFTNTSNLDRSCHPYTDCASLGMTLIKNGSHTMDRVCGYETEHSTPTTDTPIRTKKKPDSPETTYRMEAQHTLDKPYRPSGTTPRLQYSTDEPHINQTSDNHSVTSVSSETKAHSGKKEGIAATERGGPGSPSEPPSKTTWILMFLLLVTLCLLLYLCITCKTRSIKNKLEWAGRAFARYQPMFPNSNTETPDAARDVREAEGQGSSQGKIQQVTMEHVGKADGINNTVGSIFIYSPGMVILGSNSNEKKEESETSVDDGGEATCLMSVPQQESSSEEDIRVATQEELGKELSVPVPATSK
ncbi:uncharacterized protein LOC113657187 isoform X2 [Tachysurus fulvidraco]|uniref:uncharacterized protein LOC113657187 isoform X2 n=1 Tax=Tachysurus fulvidraco TaxID=1234273 RepID=UPI001FEE56C4|nr:uncharacterized protein LOC113657187 isoform X2 [Tachysurus fulvidraco]